MPLNVGVKLVGFTIDANVGEDTASQTMYVIVDPLRGVTDAPETVIEDVGSVIVLLPPVLIKGGSNSSGPTVTVIVELANNPLLSVAVNLNV